MEFIITTISILGLIGGMVYLSYEIEKAEKAEAEVEAEKENNK